MQNEMNTENAVDKFMMEPAGISQHKDLVDLDLHRNDNMSWEKIQHLREYADACFAKNDESWDVLGHSSLEMASDWEKSLKNFKRQSLKVV